MPTVPSDLTTSFDCASISPQSCANGPGYKARALRLTKTTSLWSAARVCNSAASQFERASRAQSSHEAMAPRLSAGCCPHFNADPYDDPFEALTVGHPTSHPRQDKRNAATTSSALEILRSGAPERHKPCLFHPTIAHLLRKPFQLKVDAAPNFFAGGQAGWAWSCIRQRSMTRGVAVEGRAFPGACIRHRARGTS